MFIFSLKIIVERKTPTYKVHKKIDFLNHISKRFHKNENRISA